MLSWSLMYRRILAVALLLAVSSVLYLYHSHGPTYWLRGRPTTYETRLIDLSRSCSGPNPFYAEYGQANIRLSRAYEGSRHRLEQFILKLLRDEPVKISAIGGSVTKGHHVDPEEIWFYRLGEWLNGFIPSNITSHNGAAPATGSDYFSFCFPLHIPRDSDLVVVELAINDQGIPEHGENMENLLRGLLDLPNKPAVILAEALAFSNGGMGGGGGRMHLPVAEYYDVPVVNQRLPLATHFARFPQLVRPYFTQDWWQNPDTRHINARGHRDLALLVASLLRDVGCDLALQGPTDEIASEMEPWRQEKKDDQEIGELMPGMWMDRAEYGILPRLKVLEGWDPNLDHVTPPFHPTCLSTRSSDPLFNLTPSASEGWEHWVHPNYLDKPYLVAHQPGSTVSFVLDTSVGVVKLYSLRSKTFGLGSIACWVDGESDRAVRIDGYWDDGSNIGRFTTIRDDLPAGNHDVTCELLNETLDPEGGHEFRIISIMSV